jgi:predicted Zn-dependent protease with MMP-like domain
MKQAEFEKLVEEAVAELPEFFREKMSNVIIIVRRSAPLRRERGVLLGLYESIPLLNRGTGYSGALPDKITLFKNALESGSGNHEEIKARVKHTVMHEIAHHFGISDEELRQKGLY